MELSRAQRADGAERMVAAAGSAVSPPVDERPHVAPARTRSVRPDAALLRRNRVLAPSAVDAAAHAYKMLRTQTLQLLRKHGFNSLAVVSPAPDDGRTLTAINLAIATAEDPDHTALLVDMDLRQPSVHRYLGLDVAHGVGDCLRNERDVADVLVRLETYPKLVVLPGAGPVTQSSEMLSGDNGRRLTVDLRKRYTNRVVIYDLPPLLATDDALAFLPHVEAALLVVCEGRTRREDVQRCLELLRDIPIVGTVLNGSREPAAAQG